MPPRYLTPAEFLALRGEAELLRLAGPGGEPALTNAIEQAEAEATSYLLARYRTALPSTPDGAPPILKAKVAALAHRRLLAGGQPSPALETEAQQALAWLRDVARGAASLDLAAGAARRQHHPHRRRHRPHRPRPPPPGPGGLVMRITVTIEGAAEAVQLLEAAAARLEQPPRPLLESLAAALQTYLQAHIQTQTGPEGPWPPLAPATRKIRAYYGHPPDGPALIRGGDLLQSITTLALEDRAVEVGTRAPVRPHAPGRRHRRRPEDRPHPRRPGLPLRLRHRRRGPGPRRPSSRSTTSMPLPDPTVYPALPWSLDAQILLALREQLLADAALRTAFVPRRPDLHPRNGLRAPHRIHPGRRPVSPSRSSPTKSARPPPATARPTRPSCSSPWSPARRPRWGDTADLLRSRIVAQVRRIVRRNAGVLQDPDGRLLTEGVTRIQRVQLDATPLPSNLLLTVINIEYRSAIDLLAQEVLP